MVEPGIWSIALGGHDEYNQPWEKNDLEQALEALFATDADPGEGEDHLLVASEEEIEAPDKPVTGGTVDMSGSTLGSLRSIAEAPRIDRNGWITLVSEADCNVLLQQHVQTTGKPFIWIQDEDD